MMLCNRMQGSVERACLLTLVVALCVPSEKHSSCNAVSSSQQVMSRSHYDPSALATHGLISLNNGYYVSSDALQPQPVQSALMNSLGNIKQLLSKLESDYESHEDNLQTPDTNHPTAKWSTLPKMVERRSWEELEGDEGEELLDDATDPHDSITKHYPPNVSLVKRGMRMNPFLRYRLRRYRAFHGNNKLSNIWTPRFQSSSFLFRDDDRNVVPAMGLPEQLP